MNAKYRISLFLLTLSCLCQPIVYAAFYGKVLCKQPGYHCKRIKSGQSWFSLWPNPRERNIVKRVNRMNTQIYAGLTLAVPDNLQQIDIMDLSPFKKQIQPSQEKVIVVDPEAEAWGAYDNNGQLVKWGPISAGRDYCKDIDDTCRTHEGEYRIYSLGSSDCISRKFPLPDGGAPMPYCMYFNNGQALHGEPNGLPGYNDSHGCVRMYVNDAEWLRYSFVEGPTESNEYRGTKIIVGNYGTDNPYDERSDRDDDSNNNGDYNSQSNDDGPYY